MLSSNICIDNETGANQMKKWWNMEINVFLSFASGKSKQGERSIDILKETIRHTGKRYEVLFLGRKIIRSAKNSKIDLSTIPTSLRN